MYRPVMLMASDHQSTTQDSIPFGSQDSKKLEPTTKTSTSSKARTRKAPAKPKRPAPQRGVGVAQLERLRIQRGLGIGAPKSPPLPSNPAEAQPQPQVVQNVCLQEHSQPQFQYYQNSETQSDPLNSIPVLYGASNYDGAMSGGGGGGSGLVGLERSGLLVNGSAGFGYGFNVRLHNEVGGLVMDQSRYGVVGAGATTVYEIPNELSSLPKMKQQRSSSSSSKYCCCCKQVINGSDLPGFVPKNIPNVQLAGETSGCFKGGTYSGSRSSLVDESVEVRAVHRKGKQAGGAIMMEYEFFPDHNNNNNNSSPVVSSGGTYPMEHESTTSSSVGRSSEASDQYLGGASNEKGADMMMMMMSSSSYSPVDLSLKLSF